MFLLRDVEERGVGALLGRLVVVDIRSYPTFTQVYICARVSDLYGIGEGKVRAALTTEGINRL